MHTSHTCICRARFFNFIQHVCAYLHTHLWYTSILFMHTRAGADLYVRLSASADSQRRRALGRMTDPENPDGPSYHLEFDPPPESDPALGARLVPVQDMTTVDALFMERMLAYHQESLALDVWFDKFDNVITVDADGTVDNVFQVCVCVPRARVRV
jgi:hypothetical protein